MAENERYLSERRRLAGNLIAQNQLWRITVKLLKFLSPAALLLLAASSLFAQTNMPDPNDSACWQSLAALHSCVQAENDRAMAQAERCTSYPEYQCQPEPEQPRHKQEAQLQKRQKKTDDEATTLVVNPAPANSPASEGH
jgi:hypothetical protein